MDNLQQDGSQVIIYLGPAVVLALVAALIWWIRSRGGVDKQ